MSIKTEDSILREISEHIQCTTKLDNQHEEQNDVELNTEENVEHNTEENVEHNTKEDHRAELQKQVEIGEITPFEAVLKQSALELKEGYNIIKIYFICNNLS